MGGRPAPPKVWRREGSRHTLGEAGRGEDLGGDLEKTNFQLNSKYWLYYNFVPPLKNLAITQMKSRGIRGQ